MDGGSEMRPAAEIVASWVSSEDPDSYPPAGGAVLRASWAGMCPRQIAYRLLPIEPDLTRDTQTALAFAVGDAIHDVVCRAIADECDGIREAEATYLADGILLGCHADVLVPVGDTTAVCEVKSMQSYPFDLAVGAPSRRGRPATVGTGPKWGHIMQAQLGALCHGSAHIWIVYVDKSNGRIADWWLPADHGAAREEALRMADAAHDAFAGTLPAPMVPDDHGRWKVVLDPPPRGSRGGPWQCRYCDWQPSCAKSLG